MAMSWFRYFGWSDENTRTAWGYTFQWTSEHWSSEYMRPLKYSYDTLAEECLEKLDEISPPFDSQLPRNQNRSTNKAASLPKRDLYSLLQKHELEDEKLHQLWTEVNTVPEWVDWDQIARGQDVFYRYGGMALTAVSIPLSTTY